MRAHSRTSTSSRAAAATTTWDRAPATATQDRAAAACVLFTTSPMDAATAPAAATATSRRAATPERAPDLRGPRRTMHAARTGRRACAASSSHASTTTFRPPPPRRRRPPARYGELTGDRRQVNGVSGNRRQSGGELNHRARRIKRNARAGRERGRHRTRLGVHAVGRAERRLTIHDRRRNLRARGACVCSTPEERRAQSMEIWEDSGRSKTCHWAGCACVPLSTAE